mgnify:CR=1 FL=1
MAAIPLFAYGCTVVDMSRFVSTPTPSNETVETSTGGRPTVGFIDIQRVIRESHAGKSAKKKFQAEVEKVKGDLLKEKKGLGRMKSDIEKKGRRLSEKERRVLVRDLQRKARSYRRRMREFQEDLRQKEREMTAEILKDLKKVVINFAKREKFTFIIGRGKILYAAQEFDLTDKIIELYNNHTTKLSRPLSSRPLELP